MTVEEILIQTNKRLCGCGCTELIDKFDSRGRERFYKKGHSSCFNKGCIPWNKGKTGLPAPSHVYKKGKDHPAWKADNYLCYGYVHKYVNLYKPKPIDGKCEFCHLKSYEDLACITGNYDRNDFNNWKYLCRSCHFKFDYSTGLAKKKKLIPEDRKCCTCGSNKTLIHKHGYAHWFVIDKEQNLYQCTNCYQREKRREYNLQKDIL